MRWLKVLPLGLLCLTCSCASLTKPSDPLPTPTREIDASPSPFCSSFTILHFSRTGDTVETIKEAKANNAVWHSLCDPSR